MQTIVPFFEIYDRDLTPLDPIVTCLHWTKKIGKRAIISTSQSQGAGIISDIRAVHPELAIIPGIKISPGSLLNEQTWATLALKAEHFKVLGGTNEFYFEWESWWIWADQNKASIDWDLFTSRLAEFSAVFDKVWMSHPSVEQDHRRDPQIQLIASKVPNAHWMFRFHYQPVWQEGEEQRAQDHLNFVGRERCASGVLISSEPGGDSPWKWPWAVAEFAQEFNKGPRGRFLQDHDVIANWGSGQGRVRATRRLAKQLSADGGGGIG